jgi:LuxR family maltose regulon positive regulatory protein
MFSFVAATLDDAVLHSITQTKLHRPQVSSKSVFRARLVEQLNTAANLTLVIAPAGYGKTTLLSAWLETGSVPSAWLSLDEHDNDLVTFVSYLVAAVRTLFPAACHDTLQLLNGVTLPTAAVINRCLSNELSAIEQDFVLVLDDYHLIHEGAIHEVMAALTRHPPPALHLVFAARNDLALPLASLRARGRVIELREADLRFSLEETATLLRKEMRLQVDDQTIADLKTYTEGWVAGLRLMALYFQQTGNLAGLAPDSQGYDRYVMSYLVAEVLAHVPIHIEAFLINTSILDRFCGPLCEAMTGTVAGEGNSQACLEWLESNNLFLVSVDEDRRWFRYHHLFRRLLIDQLERQRGRAAASALHAKASVWFEQNGYAEEALQHALAANDTAAALQIVARHRRELTNDEQWHRLDRWVHLFPRAVIDGEPELLLSEAWFLINRQQLGDIPRALDRVEALLAQQPSDTAATDRLQGEVQTRRATQYYYAGDLTRSMMAAQRALEKVPAEWWMLRAQARLFLSNGYLAAGDLRQAYAVLYDTGEPTHNHAFQMRMLVAACIIHWLASDLPSVAQAATQILNGSEQSGSQVETTTWASFYLGVCHYARNDLAQAEHHLAAVVKQPYQAHVQCYLNSAAALALAYQAQDRANQAREIAERMVSFALEIQGTAGLSLAKAFQAELALRQGRLAEAIYWAEQNDAPILIPRPFFYRPPLTLARILLAQNTPHSRRKAAQVLSEQYSYYTAIHYTSVVIEVLALQSLLYQAQDHAQLALDTLQRALALAEPAGVIRVFVDCGKPLAQLLTALVCERAGSAYATRILAAFPPAVSPSADRGRTSAALLTSREREVLELLAIHYTDKEIAAALVISAETVHSHVQHIADKLGVRGRRAIAQAVKDHEFLQ